LGELRYKPLIGGIDTLEIGYSIVNYDLKQEVWDMLEEGKNRAQDTLYDKGTSIKFREYDFIVLRVGTGRYKYILTNDDLDVRINPSARSGEFFPELRVRLKSQFLWRNGWKSAITKIDWWIRTWAYVIEVKVSRIDITVDFLGKLPKLTPELKEIVTRSRKKGVYINYDKYLDGNEISGYTFGKGDLLCRIYDKTKEIKVKGKKWFKDLWRTEDWKEGEIVTRIEFQVRRKVIKEMKINTTKDLTTKLPDLWKYFTTEWLTIRKIKKDSHRTRWPVSKLWMVVQSGYSKFGNIVGVSRLKQLRADKDIIERNLEGYCYSLVAMAMSALPGTDIEYGKKYLIAFLEDIIEGQEFEAKVRKRLPKYNSME
jgi:hypothetical protein